MSTIQQQGRPAVVLLAEDNEDDYELTKIGFERAKLAVNLQHVWNGEECMDYLRRQGKFADAPPPDIVLLDLNMPRMGGLEVLKAINDDPALQHIPVVILTTSIAQRDILEAYRLRCSSCITKPVDFDNFVKVVQGFSNYWFTLVVLPSETGPLHPG